MEDILEGEGMLELENKLMPAIILHDIGWSQLGEEKNYAWHSKENRILHMKEGAKIAKRILLKTHYKIDLIERIVYLVGTHDKEYLRESPVSLDEKFLRDADSCFIFSEVSFWKDYHLQGSDYTPQSFLEILLEKYSKKYTEAASIIVKENVKKRKKEIRDTSIDPEERYYKLKKEAKKRTLDD